MNFILLVISNFIYFYSILLGLYALLSWFPGAYRTALGRFVSSLVEPYLRLFRRLPLQIGGLDFTVLVAIFALNAVYQLLIPLLAVFL